MPDVRLLTPLVRLLVAGLLVRLLVSLWVYRRPRARRRCTVSDRYAIRTRNLQDWNLTRYRCANRSKVKQRRTQPRYGFDVSDSVALVSSGIVGISPECSMTRRFSRRGSHVIRLRGLAKRGLRRGAGRGGWLVGLAAAAASLPSSRHAWSSSLSCAGSAVSRRREAPLELDRRPPERLLRRGGGAPKLSLNTSTSMVTVGPPSEAEPSSRSSIVFASKTSRPPIVWRAERGIVFSSTGACGEPSLIERALRRSAAGLERFHAVRRRWRAGSLLATQRSVK